MLQHDSGVAAESPWGGTGARQGGKEGDEGGRGRRERRRGEVEVLAKGQKPPELNLPGVTALACPAV